ncbi:MAG: hypothetical protein EOM55_03655 [Clostridia bacterium]|nr:hypothetical protein [Clostridia bacterium]
MIGILLIFWGLIFAGIPIYSYIETSQNSASVIPFFVVVIFGLIGIVAFLLGIYNIYFSFKRKLISKIGTETVATFLDMQVGYTQNGTKIYFIKYFYTDENNVHHEEKSATKFRYQQAYYFKTLFHFKIRYMGKKAVITEPLDFERLAKMPTSEQESFLHFSSQPVVSASTHLNKTIKVPKLISKSPASQMNMSKEQYSKNFNQKEYYVCDYCGYVQDAPGKCLCCGARIKPKK